MIKFLQLIRFPNLVMMALTQLLFYYYFIVPFDDFYISANLFYYIVLATVLIASGGNMINDIFDVTADRINKPKKTFIGTFISKKYALILYGFTTFVGIGLGSYVGFVIGRWWIALVFFGIALLLYLYSSHLKKVPLAGNLLISFLVASSLLILSLFSQSKKVPEAVMIALFIYAGFAFLVNLIREIVKDMEDINGDYNANLQTLPIVLGRNRVGKITAILAGICIAFIVFCINQFLIGKEVTTIYILFTVLLPLLFFIVKIWQATTTKHYKQLSIILKLIMLFGTLSMVIYYHFDSADMI